MRMFFPILVVCLALSGTISAQSAYPFRSQEYIGMHNGESGAALSLQTINGVQHKDWFMGLGAGLDYYRLRSIPLFLSVSRFITPAQRSFFISADGGVNFMWPQTDKTIVYDSRWKPGLYAAGSVGYKIGLKDKSDAFLMSIGYSAKYLKEKRETPTICFNPPCAPTVETYNYGLNRLSIRLGWQF